MSMEADKCQDLQSTSWKLKRDNEIIIVCLQRPKNPWNWCISSPNVGRLQTQEVPMFQFESEGR